MTQLYLLNNQQPAGRTFPAATRHRTDNKATRSPTASKHRRPPLSVPVCTRTGIHLHNLTLRPRLCCHSRCVVPVSFSITQLLMPLCIRRLLCISQGCLLHIFCASKESGHDHSIPSIICIFINSSKKGAPFFVSEFGGRKRTIMLLPLFQL